MMEGDTMTEDQAERLLLELALQLNRLNDHLAQIAGELHHIHEDAPITEWRRDKPYHVPWTGDRI